MKREPSSRYRFPLGPLIGTGLVLLVALVVPILFLLGAGIPAGFSAMGWAIYCVFTSEASGPSVSQLILPVILLGALLGAFLGCLLPKRWRGVVLVLIGLVGLSTGVLVLGGASLSYLRTPYFSPRPCPGSQVASQTVAPGSWGLARIQTYTAEQSITAMQRYYEKQMKQYCEGTWQFEQQIKRNNPTCPPDGAMVGEEEPLCLEAQCEIPRPWLEQYFEITLCQIDATHTQVEQIDRFED